MEFMGNLVIPGLQVKSDPRPVQSWVRLLRNMDNLAIPRPLEQNCYGIMGNLANPVPIV